MTAVRACQREPRINACVNQDGGTADGVFLQYPDAKPLTQPFLYVEAAPPPMFTDPQLAERGITREAWTDNARIVERTREAQLQSGLAGSYKVVLRAPGMSHMSFGDTPLSATSSAVQAQALHNLRLTTTVTRAFLDTFLTGAKGTVLDGAGTSEIQVTRYKR
jgi:hypothetical protein